jgi:crossover junction endodeoxyribonuclease RusA
MIRVEIPFPPSMNRLWRASKGGKVYRAPEYVTWKEGACWSIAAQCRAERVKGPFKLTMLVVPPDKRHRDLDNLFKASLDALAAAGVIANDRHCRWIEARWVEDGAPCTLILDELEGTTHE